MTDLSRFCIHTITTKPWSLDEAIENYAREGVSGITVWRDALEGLNVAQAGQRIRDAGLTVVSVARGGFFPSIAPAERAAAIDENRRCIDEAAELGAPLVVLVCGADPRQPLADSRAQIRDGIAAILPYAAERGVKLAIEPLHPMYADTRSAITTLAQASDLCVEFDSRWLGVAVDVYHVWWDPALEAQIIRTGMLGKLFAFHICDWLSPTVDMLNDRGLMGEGCIPVRQIRGWVEQAGFEGFNEVEIFSMRWWAHDQLDFLRQIKRAYLEFA